MAPDEPPDPPSEDPPGRDPWIDPAYPDIISPGNGKHEPFKLPDWWPFPAKPPTKRPPKETVE